MAENTQPPIVGEIQQPLEVPQGGQAEGEVDQDSSQGLPPPGATVPNQPPADTHQKQTCRKKGDGLDICRFIVELITLGVLLWYTVITNGLWEEANDANRFNVESAHLDQRAWLSVAGVHLTKVPTVGEKIHFVISKQNTGKTPALRVVNRIRFNIIAPKNLDDFFYVSEEEDGNVVPPGGQLFPTTFDIPDKAETLIEGQVADVVRGTVSLYLYGIIKYDDIFSGHHFTRFCTVYVYNEESPTLSNFCKQKDYNYME